MSQLLRHLLHESDPRFSVGLTRLEHAAGNPGIDVRLTSEVLAATRAKLVSLGLDPHDTTGQELFLALKGRVVEADEILRAYLGHPASADLASNKAAELCRTIIGKKSAWAVKPASLKKILLAQPPKKVMNYFRYQTAESLVKRMPIEQIVFAARLLEGKTWQAGYMKHLSALDAKDFGRTDVSILPLTDSRWLQLIETWEEARRSTIVQSKELASVGFLLRGDSGSYAATLPALLHAASEIIVHGAYLKLHYVHSSIGQALVDALQDGRLVYVSVSDATFHWRDIHRHIGGHGHSETAAVFGHLDIADLGWIQLETALALLMPELSFWVGTDFLGVSYGSGRTISLNMHDVARSVYYKTPYTDMVDNGLQRALRSELMARYMEHPAVRALVTKQFDISDIDSQNW